MVIKRVKKTITLDAAGRSLGRLATEITRLISGRHLPEYDPRTRDGDRVKIINAKRLKFTGKKLDKKLYYHYSGYPGGLKSETLKKRFDHSPKKLITEAVRKMLPRNKLSKEALKNIEVHE